MLVTLGGRTNLLGRFHVGLATTKTTTTTKYFVVGEVMRLNF